MLLSSFFARSMAFTHTPKVQLPFALFSETFLTIRQNSLYVTVCMIVSTLLEHITHSLSTLYYYNAPDLTIWLTGDYHSRTFTDWCAPALLGTLLLHKKIKCVSFVTSNLHTLFYTLDLKQNPTFISSSSKSYKYHISSSSVYSSL